jgi:hypothetical protein
MLPNFPRLVRHGNVAYFDDDECVRWRVHDVTFGPPHAGRDDTIRHPLESPEATMRLFRRRDRDVGRRLYTFRPGEPRELDVDRLLRQLRAGSVVFLNHHAARHQWRTVPSRAAAGDASGSRGRRG